MKESAGISSILEVFGTRVIRVAEQNSHQRDNTALGSQPKKSRNRPCQSPAISSMAPPNKDRLTLLICLQVWP